jgi:ATP-binding cassette subfamily B (MDR/TAP) protein 1
MEEKIELQPITTVKKDLAPVSYKTLFRYATAGDIMMMIAGIISAVAAGAAFPLTTVVFGMNFF